VAGRPRSPLLRPEFGPTLPALLRRRAGVPEPLTIAAVVAVAAVLGLVMALNQPGREVGEHLVHRGEPVYNLIYDGDALREVRPRAGELTRLEGRRGRVAIAITVRPLRLPPYRGDVAHGLLPVFASGHIERLRAAFDGFELREQLRARINGAPGFEVGFRFGPPDRRTNARDVMLLPSERDPRGAVLLSFRQTVAGTRALGAEDHRWSFLARRAFRSFTYGTGRV
jgi:hypothetical protein